MVEENCTQGAGTWFITAAPILLLNFKEMELQIYGNNAFCLTLLSVMLNLRLSQSVYCQGNFCLVDCK